jgi:hypothetical protein
LILTYIRPFAFKDSETVKVNYTDIEMEARLHGLDTRQQPIPNIIKMLDGLTAEVTVP